MSPRLTSSRASSPLGDFGSFEVKAYAALIDEILECACPVIATAEYQLAIVEHGELDIAAVEELLGDSIGGDDFAGFLVAVAPQALTVYRTISRSR